MKVKKYTNTSTSIILFFVIGLAIIPLEIFLKDLLSRLENNFIIDVQDRYKTDLTEANFEVSLLLMKLVL